MDSKGLDRVRRLGKAGVTDGSPVSAWSAGCVVLVLTKMANVGETAIRLAGEFSLSTYPEPAPEGSPDASRHLAIWICNTENRARESGSGTASRSMGIAMGGWMLITQRLVSREPRTAEA